MRTIFRGVLSRLTSALLPLLLSGVFVGALPGSALATSFSLSTSVGGSLPDQPVACGGPSTPPCGNFEYEGATNLDLSGSNRDYSASVAATAGFGTLGAKASTSFDLAQAGIRIVFGAAGWTDGLTISAPGLDGTAGSLDLSFLLEGALAKSGSGNAAVLVGIGWSNAPFDPNNSVPQFFTRYTAIPSTGTTVAQAIPFTFGQTFYLGSFLAAFAGSFTPCDSCDLLVDPIAVTGAGSGSADFYNTLALTGLLPYSNGQLVSDARFSSDSGTQYSLNGVVPEPASFVLLGTGLALCRRRWRQRHP